MRIGGMYTIDFTRVSKIPKFNVSVKTGDSKRTISLILLENNKIINLNDYTVTVAAKKSDGNDIFNDVSIVDAENGICEVEVTKQMSALDTDFPCEIVLYGADGTVASSSNFVISKISSVRNEESIVSSSEFTALSKALTEVKNIDNRFKEVDSQIKDKANIKNVRENTDLKPINYTEFDNDTKQKFTGGAVAVVGKKSVGFEELKDNSIVNDKVNNITLEKITDIENGGLTFAETKKLYNKTLFDKSKELEDSFICDTNGLIELIYDINTSNNTIKQSQIVINGVNINTVKLLPNESINNTSKDVCFEKRSIKEFTFDMELENDGEWSRIACSTPVSDLYKKDITGYNVIVENDNKFKAKPQTEFSSYKGNLIGLHSNGTLQMKVSKSEVEGASKTFDKQGILEYVNDLSDFNIYLRYATKKSVKANLSIPVYEGDNVKLNGTKFNMLYKNEPEPTLITTYNSFATNNNNFNVTNRIIKINCEFDYGVLKSLKCIKVKDITGRYVECQAINNESVKYGKTSDSLHKDGSIKNCSILLIDSFSANETKEYIIEVYSDEINNEENFDVLEDGTKYNVIYDNITLEFNKTKNNMLTHIYKNGQNINSQTNSIPFRLTHNVLDVTNNISDVGTLKEFTIKNGVVMCSINTKIEFNNILHDLTYEFYKNGEIRCINYNKSLNNVNNCYGILLRSNTEYINPIYSTKNPTSYYEANGVSTRVVYSNGDVPRDDGYGYPVFKTKALGMRIGETNCYSCICGWEFADSDTKYQIPRDFIFSNCVVINTTSNGKDNAYELNPIIGEVVRDNIVNSKHFIKSNIVRLVKAINPQMEKLSSNDLVPTKFLPSLYARLILAKETDLYTIDEISNVFKLLMVKDYNADTSTKLVNVTNLKAIYDAGSSPLHMSARVFPICKFLLKEYKKLGNLDEINYFETTIKEYAEFVCQVFEEKGNTPLYGNKPSLNCNSTASGCKALSDGLEIEENTRWRNALNGNVEVLNKYKVENILKESDNISSGQYLHYHAFAAHDYFACSSLKDYIIHPTQYINMCLNSKGELMDEIWCCSRSRRGLTSTIAYIVFLLVKNNTPQSIQLCNKILNTLWENFNYDGIQDFPLYGFDLLPPQTDETSTPMQLQALCETYYTLEEMGI